MMGVAVVMLDIEGTVCPISFVKEVLFPYALSSLEEILPSQWDDPSFTPYRDAFPLPHRTSPSVFLDHVKDLMARDLKIAYLKNLQGWLWVRGYESGELKCPLFPDVYPAMQRWHEEGKKIVIYSSGSVAAQKLLFQYTDTEPDADLRPLISDYFDTVNAGLKQEKGSYSKIFETQNHSVEVEKWLFLSDRPEEVKAAKEAGMQSLVVVREGNARLSEEDEEKYQKIKSFDELFPTS